LMKTNMVMMEPMSRPAIIPIDRPISKLVVQTIVGGSSLNYFFNSGKISVM
jgi:hypothetical protein